jgi:hypothetical protein
MSGYVSHIAGEAICVLEDRCLGKGHAACNLLGRTRAQWGEERAEELRFFEPNRLKESLDVSLERVTETLKAAEQKPGSTAEHGPAWPGTSMSRSVWSPRAGP